MLLSKWNEIAGLVHITVITYMNGKSWLKFQNILKGVTYQDIYEAPCIKNNLVTIDHLIVFKIALWQDLLYRMRKIVLLFLFKIHTLKHNKGRRNILFFVNFTEYLYVTLKWQCRCNSLKIFSTGENCLCNCIHLFESLHCIAVSIRFAWEFLCPYYITYDLFQSNFLQSIFSSIQVILQFEWKIWKLAS